MKEWTPINTIITQPYMLVFRRTQSVSFNHMRQRKEQTKTLNDN